MMQITLWFNYVIKYKVYKYINKKSDQEDLLMKKYTEMTKDELLQEKAALEAEYEKNQRSWLKS